MPYNLFMPRLKWVFFVFSIAAGIGLGLLYGWVINPVQYIDTTPETLRIDFRTDYALMAAENYAHDHNVENAAAALTMLGSQAPASLVNDTIIFAIEYNYPPEDIKLLQNLEVDLKSWHQPGNSQP